MKVLCSQCGSQRHGSTSHL